MINLRVSDEAPLARSFIALALLLLPSRGMAVSIDVGSAAGEAGDTVSIEVALATMGEDVAGTDNRISFDPDTPVVGCAFHPDLTTVFSGFNFEPSGCTPGIVCTSVRALLITFPATIPDGTVIYSCDVAIDPDAGAGVHELPCSDAASSDPFGASLTTTCSDGVVSVVAPLDHFKCYKAKDLKNPKFASTTVSLSDQFGVNDGAFDVKKPFLFCNPADKNGEGIANPVDHLACYKVKGPKLEKGDRPTVEVDNQLGVLQLEVKKPFLLCVPSTKTVIP